MRNRLWFSLNGLVCLFLISGCLDLGQVIHPEAVPLICNLDKVVSGKIQPTKLQGVADWQRMNADLQESYRSNECNVMADGTAESAIDTNNQFSDAAEGGIVKLYKKDIISLYQGQLRRVSTKKELSLEAIVDVTPVNMDNQVWYDELIVQKDKAFVIGYRYDTGLAGMPKGMTLAGRITLHEVQTIS
jgi:hypothetical protein